MGIHLMRTGELDADLTHLFRYGPPYLPELVAAKREAEHGGAPPVPTAGDDVARLTAELQEARDTSALPETATAGPALHDLVVRTRLGRP
ncbi:hypothetical protein [Nonomuraea sp. NPDC048916]|uniref:hypothetical protein n=1 Tax=Nonomuraea sp. NPDC048916 TaxID=3154232 RepID=UPI0034011110